MTRLDETSPVVLDQDFFRNPHAQYGVLRRERPVTRAISPVGTPIWLVTRYEDVRAALASPHLGKDGGTYMRLVHGRDAGEPGSRDAPELADSLGYHMLAADPPDHTRLRRLVGKAFTPRAIAELRPRIEQIAEELADAMAAGPARVDLLDAYAFPLPITVISEMLGIPSTDRDAFRSWSNTMLSAASQEDRADAMLRMAGFLSDLVDAKRAEPSDDMLSAIVLASDEEDRLTHTECIAMAFLLLVAGHETTVNLIGNGTLALLRNPEQLAALRTEPDLVPRAVEEFLRFDGPINLATFRFTNTDTTIGGVDVPAGQPVFVSLLAANRDPAQFPDGDRLDVRRDANHLAFGFGIHYCLGAPLARLEGAIAFRTLLARFPGLRLAAAPTELTWRESTLMHGLRTLPVELR